MSADRVRVLPERSDRELYWLNDVLATAAAVNAAIQLGILDQLHEAPASVEEIAQRCATAPDATHLLLDALDSLRLLRRRDDGRYVAVAEARWLATLATGWSRIDMFLRTGHPLVRADTPAGAASVYPEIVSFLSRLFAPAIGRAAELLAPVGGDVLDVGAGAAPWSIALAQADPKTQVTALDLPDILRTTRRAVEAADRAAQFHFHAGDMFTAELPHAAYDLILLANVCHLFSQDLNRTLLQKLRPALRHGGTLAIIDPLRSERSEEPEERRLLSLFALGLRMRTSTGAVYPLEAYASWTRSAGYDQLTAIPLSQMPPLALLTCTAHDDGAR